MTAKSHKPRRDPDLIFPAPSPWNRKQTVWRAQEYKKIKPLLTGHSEIALPFLSLVYDQRNSLSKVIGNQIPTKLHYQRYQLHLDARQPRHTCLISGKARGTVQDGLVARYTFRRLLRFGAWPGFIKGSTK